MTEHQKSIDGLQEERLIRDKVILVLQEEMKKTNRAEARRRRKILGIENSSDDEPELKMINEAEGQFIADEVKKRDIRSKPKKKNQDGEPLNSQDRLQQSMQSAFMKLIKRKDAENKRKMEEQEFKVRMERVVFKKVEETQNIILAKMEQIERQIYAKIDNKFDSYTKSYEERFKNLQTQN